MLYLAQIEESNGADNSIFDFYTIRLIFPDTVTNDSLAHNTAISTVNNNMHSTMQ